MPKRPPPRQVDIVKPTYQPSKAELNEDVRVNATFEEAVDALTPSGRDQLRAAPAAQGLTVALRHFPT